MLLIILFRQPASHVNKKLFPKHGLSFSKGFIRTSALSLFDTTIHDTENNETAEKRKINIHTTKTTMATIPPLYGERAKKGNYDTSQINHEDELNEYIQQQIVSSGYILVK